MATRYLYVLASAFCVFCYVYGDLDMDEGSTCITEGLNGTCTDVLTCPSAALTYLYRNAGFSESQYQLPALPRVCSYRRGRPVVCCKDCNAGTTAYKSSVVAPLGILISKKGPVAWAKCYDYFARLPYPCRGRGNIQVKKTWNRQKQCYQLELSVALAVGGRDAMRWEFPHMALLGFGDNVATAEWLCGGSIISERFILTAAHCSSTRALGSIKYAALGLLKRTDPKENWKIYDIKRIVLHPGYKAPSKYHDIALLETDREINFGRDLLPACLDVGKVTKSTAEASGWGRVGHKQTLADTLQVVRLEEFEESQCGETYGPHRHLTRGYDHELQMCYGSRTEVIDTCEGDSGGPLQTNEFKCLYTVVGVTSYGKDCGVLGAAGMYTRVAHYVPWIESVVWPGETNEAE